MKILVNGYSLDELFEIDRIIGNVKKNKKAYSLLVFVTATCMMQQDQSILVASTDFNASISHIGNQLVNMVTTFAQWSCLCMGLKEMLTTILNGGNIRDGISSAFMYCVAFVFILLYPSIFVMFKGIKF